MPLYITEVDEAFYHASVLAQRSMAAAFVHLIDAGVKIGLNAASAQAEFEHDKGGNALAASTAIQGLIKNSQLLLLLTTNHPKGL